MDMDALSQPFDDKAIKVRKGNFGQRLRYAEASEYIRRLNAVLEGRWSFEVLDHKVLDGEVVVLGKLTVDGVTKEAFGGSSITVHSQTGVPISVADDLKSASTDSLKKCASLLGVGLYLYCDSNGNARNQRVSESQNQGNSAPRRNSSARRSSPTQPPANRITIKQLGAINALARRANLTSAQVREKCVDRFQAPPERLSKSQASTIISELTAELDGSAAA